MGVCAIAPRAAWATGPTLPSLTKGPYVVDVSDQGAEIRFELASAAPAELTIAPASHFGADAATAAPTSVVRRVTPSVDHAFRVAGLVAATRYAYEVRVGGVAAGAGQFSTAPASSARGPVTFLAYGDDRSDPVAHAAVVRAMRNVPSDFLVNTGDLVQDAASASDWQSFFDVEAPILRERPLFAAVGNHELFDDRAGANFERFFGVADEKGIARLYRTVRFGIVRFFFLNAMDTGWASGDERDWLERELAHADGETGIVWRVAVLHHGPWSSGPHGPNAALAAAGVPELLSAHRVDLVLSGHDHIYERGSSGVLKYVVTGGGGAPLYEIAHADPTARKAEAAYHFVLFEATPESMQIEARRQDGSVLDRCAFASGADWSCDRDAPASEGRGAERAAAIDAPARSASRCSCGAAGEGHAPRSFEMVGGALALAALGLRRRRAVAAAAISSSATRRSDPS
jgi:MYXO-CTERM domain-containing protein